MGENLTYLVLPVLLLVSFTKGYNLEERLPLYKKGPDGSTFGFSVALHKTIDSPKSQLKRNILVVGAPTANALSSQKLTHRPGGIFYCPLTNDEGDCKRVKMDKGESTRVSNKTGQWLGVSLKSQGPGKYLITCAHRYSSVWGHGDDENQSLCGKCFLLNNTGKGGIKEITPEESQNLFIDSPCQMLDDKTKQDLTGASFAQAGTNIAFHDDSYVLGAPGTWSWTGAMFDFNLYDFADDNWHAQLNQNFFQTDGCTSIEMYDEVERCASIPVRRDSYMGFSVATSNKIYPWSNKTVFLAGAPRGNFTGAVVLYQKKSRDSDFLIYLSPLTNDVIMGPQMGSSFGYSVITCDVNGDGLDDVIIGAPQFYQYSKEGKFGGAVFIYLNTIGKLFSKVTPQRLYGPPDSFFGYSLAPLGDLDQDGYNDFAVGSPYEGSSGKVYIYRGHPSGIVQKSQILNGKNYRKLGGMTAFGISLNSDVDIDNNDYPDLLVGTLSDQAILFRTRPTISVDSSLVTSPDILDLSKPNCKYNGAKYSCFQITFCLNYTSRRDEFTGELELEYKLTLDSKRQKKNRASRVFYGKPNGPTEIEETAVIPDAGQIFCPIVNQPIYFNPTARNKLQPITVDIKFWLATDKNNITGIAGDQAIYSMINNPILNADYFSERNNIVTLKNDCGDDGCQSDLKINGSLPSQVMIGGDGRLKMRLEILNDGEEAHQAYVRIKFPQLVYYDNFTVVTSSGNDVKCEMSKKGDYLNCVLGNPFPGGGAREVIDFNLDVAALTIDIKQIVIEVSGSTSSINPELRPFFLYCDVMVEMSLSLKSYGRPQQIRYSDGPIIGESAIESTKEIGPLVEFTFNIKNEGLRPAEGLEFVVNFPYEIANGKWLLYLESARVIGGYGGYCNPEYVNELVLPFGGKARTKRKANEKEPTASAMYAAPGHAEKLSSVRTLQCSTNTSQCVDIVCNLEPIQEGATVSVNLQSRLWKYTFLEEYVGVHLINVETLGNVRNVFENVQIKGNQIQRIETTVDNNVTSDDVTAVFPWWYILIAIVGALLIYVLVVLCLFRCGFFKRQRYKHKQNPAYDVIDENDEQQQHAVREQSQI